MKRQYFGFGLMILLTGLPHVAHANNMQEIWQQACDAAGVSGFPMSRKPVGDGVVEYRAELKVGPGEHDRIAIHRMVREKAPWVPESAPRGIVLVHGSASTFRTAYAPGLVDPNIFEPEFGIAPFLAAAGMDVWGITLRWALVPAETTDFEFMKDWTIGLDAEDLQLVAHIARLTRALTGSGLSKLFYSGHSLGADVVYAFANQDSQKPQLLRDVRGLLPMDMVFKLHSPETEFLRDEAAMRYQFNRDLYDSGVYVSAIGAQVMPLIQLGLALPNEPSPVIPGFTNLEAATAIFSLTFIIYAPLPAYTPWYHFLAGTFDPETGAPTGFQFMDQVGALQFSFNFPPYLAQIQGVEVDALIAETEDLPYDDHLEQITAPTLYVGAAGGFGEFGAEVFAFLGSTDTSTHVVRLLPPGLELFDFGHVDLLWASNAPLLVWQPMLDWMLAR